MVLEVVVRTQSDHEGRIELLARWHEDLHVRGDRQSFPGGDVVEHFDSLTVAESPEDCVDKWSDFIARFRVVVTDAEGVSFAGLEGTGATEAAREEVSDWIGTLVGDPSAAEVTPASFRVCCIGDEVLVAVPVEGPGA